MFGFLKKKSEPPAEVSIEYSGPTTEVLWTKDFIQALNFKGFRRIKLKHNGNKDCLKTLDKYRPDKFSFKDLPIRLECVKKISNGQESVSISVYVDDNILGIVEDYMDKAMAMLTDYEYDKVYLMVDEKYHTDGSVMGQNVYLLVHYIGDEPEK